MQFLVRASELTAAGFSAGSQFTSINFPVASLGANWGGSITQCLSFQVKFGYTTATTLAAFQAGLTTVRPAAGFTPTVGYNNVLTFSTLPAAWNGTDNVILETTFSNNFSGAAADGVFMYNSPTAFASCVQYRVDSQTAATVAASTTVTYSYSARPDFKLAGSMTVQGAFVWSPTLGLTPTSGANVTAAPTSTTTYTATVTAPGGCAASNTASITVIPAANAGTNGSTTVCSNASAFDMATFLGTHDNGGAWTFGGNPHSNTFTPGTDAAGVYTYTVTGTAPCANAQATVTVSVTTAPNAGTSNTLAVCANSTTNDLFAALGGTPDGGGSWSPSGPNYDATVMSPGAYTYTVTGTAPCANAQATVTVSETAPPNAGTNGVLTVCATSTTNDLFAALGGTPDGGGSWSPSGPNYDATVMAPGAYTYTVTGTAPCANAQATVTVSETSAPNAGTDGTLAVCANSTTNDMFAALGGTPDGGGSWSPSGPNYDATAMSPGVYTYTVSASAPCVSDDATVTVTEVAPANAGNNGNTTVCSSDAPFALADFLGGTPDGGGSWTFGGNPHSSTFTPGTDAAGVYTYTVNSTAPCAPAQATVTVAVTAATAWYQDTDGDTYGAGAATMACTSPGAGFVTDNSDDCPSLFGRIGDSCNDNNPFTSGDVISGSCVCAGTPVASHNWSIRIVTDANGGETTYEIREQVSNFLVASGGPFASNSVIDQVVSIPDAGNWTLSVFDSGNNGMGTGGYLLKDHNGRRVIDNLGNGAGFTSVSSSPEGFRSPVGTDVLRPLDCDNVEHWPFDMIAATENTAVSAQWQVGNQTDDGYEFWFFNPNGGYSRHIFRNHATSGGYAPANAQRATKLGLASWVTSPLPQNTLLNCRVRSRVNGVNADFGPACRMKVDPVAANCHTTQLDNFAGPTFSCGVTGLRTNGTSRIWAKPVTRYIQATNTLVSANRYRFHFVNVGENTSFDLVMNTYPLQIYPQMPFQLGASYDVTVQASFDGGNTYCPYGATCQISFAANNLQMEEVVSEQPTVGSELVLWPNPNRGEELFLSMAGLQSSDGKVTIDVVNMFGEKVLGRTIAIGDGGLNTVLELDKQMASGLYLVNLTADGKTITKRLVVQR
jgi:hypothetical protein